MKVNTFIKATPHEVPSDIYQGLLQVYPDGEVGAGLFSTCLPRGHPKIQEISDYLESRGLRPWSKPWQREAGEFRLTYGRVYDKEDWEPARYLQPSPKSSFGEYDIRPYGEPLKIKVGHLSGADRKLTIACANSWWIIVSDVVRRKMEQAGLKHVAFHPVEIIGKGKEGFKQPIWELRSDLFLSPLSPRCELLDCWKQPFTGNISRGCYLYEGLYSFGELHYKECDIKSVEPFDYAMTHERFGPNEIQAEHARVASQRFYQFCVTQGFDIYWTPVRIDPD